MPASVKFHSSNSRAKTYKPGVGEPTHFWGIIRFWSLHWARARCLSFHCGVLLSALLSSLHATASSPALCRQAAPLGAWSHAPRCVCTRCEDTQRMEICYFCPTRRAGPDDSQGPRSASRLSRIGFALVFVSLKQLGVRPVSKKSKTKNKNKKAYTFMV